MEFIFDLELITEYLMLKIDFLDLSFEISYQRDDFFSIDTHSDKWGRSPIDGRWPLVLTREKSDGWLKVRRAKELKTESILRVYWQG